jgi:type II secretory pathway component PulF
VDIRERVKSGEALSDAFAAQGEMFPKLYAASLASGERSGELPNVLKRYISYTRSIMTIQKKVVGALIYPAILICVSIIIVVIMIFKVIPTFASLFKDLGTTCRGDGDPGQRRRSPVDVADPGGVVGGAWRFSSGSEAAGASASTA